MRTATRFWAACGTAAATRTVPVIMVTAKTSEIDVVKGLDHGADDYLCKPFGIMEFISRVKAVLRRASTAPASTTTLRFGDITLDDVARTVTVDGEPVELTFKEYSLLHFFLEHPEEVLARERIMKAVWDTDDLLESRTIDMHVRTLRQKAGPRRGRHLHRAQGGVQTVRQGHGGRGRCLIPPKPPTSLHRAAWLTCCAPL